MAWDSDFRLPLEPFFTAAQKAQLEAIFDAIQPDDPDRGVPGARQSQAADYLDLLLNWDDFAGPVDVHEDLPKWREAYPRWLSALEAAAVSEQGKGLARLSRAQVSDLLASLQTETLAGFGADQSSAFGTMWRHCLQGCWGDPRWGGNRDRIMWRWLGYLQASEPVSLELGE